MLTDVPTRPIVRYHGGKWKLAPWIISHFPEHRVYTESFGGGGSVLVRKPRSYAEVYNDLDGEIVNVFRVLRDKEKAAELAFLIYATPFSRDEFELSYEETDDDIERARRAIFRSYAGFGSNAINIKSVTGFRSNTTRSYTTPAHDWKNLPEIIPSMVARLRGVVIENKPAIEVIQQHDAPTTLHYVDPPLCPLDQKETPMQKLPLRNDRLPTQRACRVPALMFRYGCFEWLSVRSVR